MKKAQGTVYLTAGYMFSREFEHCATRLERYTVYNTETGQLESELPVTASIAKQVKGYQPVYIGPLPEFNNAVRPAIYQMDRQRFAKLPETGIIAVAPDSDFTPAELDFIAKYKKEMEQSNWDLRLLLGGGIPAYITAARLSVRDFLRDPFSRQKGQPRYKFT